MKPGGDSAYRGGRGGMRGGRPMSSTAPSGALRGGRGAHQGQNLVR